MGGGSSNSKKKIVKNPVEAHWDTVEQNELFSIVRNKEDGRQAEEYHYPLDNRYDPATEAVIYERRRKTTYPIVRAYDHQFQAKGKKEIGPNNKFRVVTERIPHRLSQAPQLTYDESLYVLSRSLQGYQYLYKNVGPFDVNSNMIGFTPEGEARVWHNENFGMNYPHHQKRTLQSTMIDETHRYDSDYAALEEVEMVRNIVNVIEDRNEQGQFPEPFRSVIRQNVGFQEARRLVADELDESERIKVNRVDLWRNMVKSRISRLHTTNATHLRSDIHSTALHHHNPTNVQFTHNYTPINASNVHPVNFGTTSSYQTNYETVNNYPTKNAYSFSQNRSTFDNDTVAVRRN